MTQEFPSISSCYPDSGAVGGQFSWLDYGTQRKADYSVITPYFSITHRLVMVSLHHQLSEGSHVFTCSILTRKCRTAPTPYKSLTRAIAGSRVGLLAALRGRVGGQKEKGLFRVARLVGDGMRRSKRARLAGR